MRLNVVGKSLITGIVDEMGQVETDFINASSLFILAYFGNSYLQVMIGETYEVEPSIEEACPRICGYKWIQVLGSIFLVIAFVMI